MTPKKNKKIDFGTKSMVTFKENFSFSSEYIFVASLLKVLFLLLIIYWYWYMLLLVESGAVVM